MSTCLKTQLVVDVLKALDRIQHLEADLEKARKALEKVSDSMSPETALVIDAVLSIEEEAEPVGSDEQHERRAKAEAEASRLRLELAEVEAERDATKTNADRWYRTSQELVDRAEAAEARLAEAERVIMPFAVAGDALDDNVTPTDMAVIFSAYGNHVRLIHLRAAAKFMEQSR